MCMLNLFYRNLKEVNNSENDTFELMEVKTSYETDTFDQAKTSDQIVLSENGLHAEMP